MNSMNRSTHGSARIVASLAAAVLAAAAAGQASATIVNYPLDLETELTNDDWELAETGTGGLDIFHSIRAVGHA